MFIHKPPTMFAPNPASGFSCSANELHILRRVLAEAFEELGLRNASLTTPDKEAETRERLAKAILAAAQIGERDPQRLKRYAVAFLA